MSYSKYSLLLATMILATILSACGPSAPASTATLSLDQVQTQVIATYSAGLTQAAQNGPLPTLPLVNTVPAFNTLPPVTFGPPLATATQSVIVNATTTCYKLLYIKDVTIPDNTQMTPGQSFTKTWLVQNSGTCAWAAGFKFSLVSGDAMGGTTLTLPSAVASGAQINLSIAMVAPNKTGTVSGTWRMANAASVLFGDPLTVVIVLSGATATATGTSSGSTATFTATTAATATSTSTPQPPTNTTAPPSDTPVPSDTPTP